MDLELAEATLRFLEDHPEQFNMDDWLVNHDLGFDLCGVQNNATLKPEVVKHCGTVGCFAGWVVGIAVRDFGFQHNGLGSACELACKLLDIPKEGSDELFYTSRWSDDLAGRFTQAEDKQDRRECVRILRERVEDFITEHEHRATA